MSKEVIKIIGVGGITNQLLPTLIASFPKAELVLHDGDSYEPKNLERQPFAIHPGNKAIATANALVKMGVKARGVPVFVNPDNVSGLIGEGDTVFLAPDNYPTRKIVNDRCLNLRNVLLINGGNELVDGSVQVFYRRNGVSLTPPLTYCHPEIEKPKGKAPYEMGCLAVAESDPQIAETNLAVGLTMIEAYADTIKGDLVAEIYVRIRPDVKQRVRPEERGWVAA